LVTFGIVIVMRYPNSHELFRVSVLWCLNYEMLSTCKPLTQVNAPPALLATGRPVLNLPTPEG